MKFWSEKVRLTGPLRGVALGSDGRCAAKIAEERLREAERSSYERGRIDGEKSLSELLMRQRGELLELQNGVLNSMRQTLPQIVRESEEMLVRLALQVAAKLVADIPISSAMVEAAVREALSHVEHAGAVVVALNKDDFELLQRTNSPLLLPTAEADHLRFETSSDVTRGGCFVRTKFGTVDARRETKLELVAQSLDTTCN